MPVLRGGTFHWMNEAEVGAFLAAGHTRRNVLDVVLGVGMKTLSNYTNHLAHTPLDPAWEARSGPGPPCDDPGVLRIGHVDADPAGRRQVARVGVCGNCPVIARVPERDEVGGSGHGTRSRDGPPTERFPPAGGCPEAKHEARCPLGEACQQDREERKRLDHVQRGQVAARPHSDDRKQCATIRAFHAYRNVAGGEVPGARLRAA